MSPEKYRRIQSLIKGINKQASRANEFDIVLGDGEFAATALGEIADDLARALAEYSPNGKHDTDEAAIQQAERT